MELVRGVKITDYCDQNQLNTTERLNLMIKVCHAVQHAHQKGIIHRDIKPSNIMVTLHDGVPVPKVIDFGIAKATEGRLTAETVYTQLHQFMGTPAYMSPEQAEMSGLDIDTRSDIYSLGVLLYELLAGRTPFDGKELIAAGLDAMRKTIREQEPVRPSTSFSTLKGDDLTATAKRRSTDTTRLLHQLQGDLDWIAMKCLEKDRTRRYETANGLAMDIERHLANEPVIARPPSSGYRFQKMMRRNKVAFVVAATFVAALGAGLAVSTWMFLRERQAHYRAQKAEASEADQKASARRELYDSLVGQARETRLARRMGYRDKVFKLLQEARDLQVPQKDPSGLRREAVAALGDFVGLMPTTFDDFPTNSNITSADLDVSGKLGAFALANGTILLREIPSGREVARLAGTNYPASLSFNSTGDQLFALYGPIPGTRKQGQPAVRLYIWNRRTNGIWSQTENSLLPGAIDLSASTKGMFASIVTSISPLQEHAANPDSKLRLFNLQTRTFVPGIEMTNVRSAALSPDGQYLAVQNVDPTDTNKPVLELWEVESGRRVGRQQTQLASSGSLEFSPDGTHLSYFSVSGGTVYSLPGFQRVSDLKEFFRSGAAIANDTIAVPIRHQMRIRLWSLARQEDIAFLEEPEDASPLAFAPDARFLVTLSARRPWVYRLETPEKLTLHSHSDAVTSIAFSPDGARIVSVGKDRVARVSDAVKGDILWDSGTLPGPGQCVGYSADGQWLVTGDWETDLIWIWDAHTGERLLELRGNGVGRIWAAQFSPDGHFVAATGRSGTKIWEIQHGSPGDRQGKISATLFKSATASGNSLLFSPDAKFVVFEGSGIYIWDFQRADQPRSVGPGVLWGVQCCSFTPDSRQLMFTTGTNVEVATFDLATEKCISSFPIGDIRAWPASIWNFCLSPDGSLLAFDTRSVRGVEIWDPKTGKYLYSLPEENSTVYALAWSLDSRRLAVARENGDIAIWSLREIEQVLASLRLN